MKEETPVMITVPLIEIQEIVKLSEPKKVEKAMKPTRKIRMKKEKKTLKGFLRFVFLGERSDR